MRKEAVARVFFGRKPGLLNFLRSGEPGFINLLSMLKVHFFSQAFYNLGVMGGDAVGCRNI